MSRPRYGFGAELSTRTRRALLAGLLASFLLLTAAAQASAADTTTTTVVCTPASFPVGLATHCVATVTDTAATPSVPTGTVTFGSNSDGPSAFDHTSCGVVSSGDGKSSHCSVNYTPSAVGSPVVTGSYPGATGLNASSGQQTLTVRTTDPTTTTVVCTPASFPVGATTRCVATVTDPLGTVGSPSIPTGAVLFTSNSDGPSAFDNTSCTLVSHGDGMSSKCAVYYTPSAVGTPIVTGDYAALTGFQTSSGQEMLTVNAPDPTTTTVACTPASFPVTASTNCVATVTDTAGTPSVPTGSVAFTSDSDGPTAFDNTSCTLVDNGDGMSASCSVNYTPSALGTPTVTASYPGGLAFVASSGQETLTVNAADPTTTTVVCTPASFLLTASTNCVATVLDNSGTPSVPTGSVAFTSDSDGPSAFDNTSCTLVSNGDGMSSSCSVNYTPSALGTPTVTASYPGVPGFASSSGQETLTVNPPDPTTTTVACTPASFRVSTAVPPFVGTTNCVATVVDNAGAPTAPTGSVSFDDGGAGGSFDNTSCTLVDNGDGMSASCSVNYTPSAVSTPTVTASYPGVTPTWAASSGAQTLAVTTTDPTTTTVACDGATTPAVQIGSSTNCVISVLDTGGIPTPPTGTASLSSSADPSSAFSATSCTLAANGNPTTSSCSIAYTPTALGSPTITASYSGDTDFDPSTGTEVVSVVTDTTNTSVSCKAVGSTFNGNTVQAGQPVVCTATVSGLGNNSGLSPPFPKPTGTVSFNPAGFDAQTCTLVADTTSQYSRDASCSVQFTPNLVGSSATVTADYNGDGTFATSSGTSTPIRVNDPMSITCSPSAPVPNALTTCTFVVTDFSAAPSDPQVTVDFGSNGTPNCIGANLPCPTQAGTFPSQTTFGGATCVLAPYMPNEAACSVSYQVLRPGTQTVDGNIVANGVANLTGEAITTLDIPPRPSVTSVGCLPGLAVAGSPETCTATVTDTAGGTSNPVGTVSFASNGNGLLSAPSCTLEPEGVGGAVCSVNYTLPQPGTVTVSAAYSGGGIFGGSGGTQTLTYLSPLPPPPTPAPAPAPAPTPAPSRPSNAFSFGKLKLNTKLGSATLAITVPDAGKLVVSGPGFSQTKTSRGRATFTFTISAKGKALATLRRKHKVSITLHVSFTPNGGTKLTRAKSLTLIRKK